MYPKTALKILLAVILILIVAAASFWLYSRRSAPEPADELSTIDMIKVEGAINKKKQGEELNVAEQEVLDMYVGQLVDDRRGELEQKTDEEIKKEGYTQSEVDFILNPGKTIEKELGINEDKQSNSLTQEEIDAILNP